jgi:Tol biopolymer transport system component
MLTGSRLRITDVQGVAEWTSEEKYYTEVHMGPDGRTAAVAVADTRIGTRDIWIIDIEREVSTRFTFNDSDDGNAVWSPDGRQIVYCADSGDRYDIYVKDVAGTGTEELFYGDDELHEFPTSWSQDGKHLFFASIDDTGRWDIWDLPLEDGRPAGEPRALQRLDSDEITPSISPDGRWLAYSSNESGTFEIYVTNFPGAERKWSVSSSGGQVPRWAPDGSKLHFLATNGMLMEASIEEAGNSLAVGRPRELFNGNLVTSTNTNFDVTPDGGGLS